MFWRKKKKSNIVIECPQCEWSPDGGKHWGCTCGHIWNTFDTKGKCPKCKTQWEDTRCPGCGSMSSHKTWYKTPEEASGHRNSGDPVLSKHKKNLEARLISHGIKNHRIKHLPYLDYKKEEFHTPFEAGCRLLCLTAMAEAAQAPENRPQIIEWLKTEKLWDAASPGEQDFLTELIQSEKDRIEFSWSIEAALTLAWCLEKITFLPKLDEGENEEVFEEFFQNVPNPGESTGLFLTDLQYRDMAEVYEENLLNEIATTYFRDLLFNGKSDGTKIDRGVSFQRHKVLNWLRKSHPVYENSGSNIGESWDDTDTST